MEANFDNNIERTDKIGFKGKKKSSKPNLANNNPQINGLPNDKGASRAYFMGGLSFKGNGKKAAEDTPSENIETDVQKQEAVAAKKSKLSELHGALDALLAKKFTIQYEDDKGKTQEWQIPEEDISKIIDNNFSDEKIEKYKKLIIDLGLIKCYETPHGKDKRQICLNVLSDSDERISEAKVEDIRLLVNKNRIKAEDVCTCLKYGIVSEELFTKYNNAIQEGSSYDHELLAIGVKSGLSDEQQMERFKNLVMDKQGNPTGVPKEEAAICIKYGITDKNEVLAYQRARKEGLKEDDALLCAKCGLDEKDVKEYFKFRKQFNLEEKFIEPDKRAQVIESQSERFKNLKGQIPVEEALLYAKLGFDDEDINILKSIEDPKTKKQCIEIGSITIDFRYETVRKSGGIQKHPIKDISEQLKAGKDYICVKNKVLLEKVKCQYKFNLFNTDSYIKLNSEQRMACDEAMKKKKEGGLELYPSASLSYAELKSDKDNNQRQIFKDVISEKGDNGFKLPDIGEALTYAGLENEEQRKVYREIKTNYPDFMDSYARILAQMENEDQNKAFEEAYIKIKKNYPDLAYEAVSDALCYARLKSDKDNNQRQIFEDVISEKGDNGFKLPDIGEALRYAGLENEEQRKAYREIKKDYPDLTEIYASGYAKLQDEERKAFRDVMSEAGDNGFKLPDIDEALGYAMLKPHQRGYLRNLIKQNVSISQAFILAEFSIDAITPDILELLPDDFWWETGTGASEEVHSTMQDSLRFLLSNNSDVEGEISEFVPNGTLPEDCEYKDGILTHNGQNEFSVNLQKLVLDDYKKKPLLVVKDKNSNDRFVALNGAIACVKEPIEVNREELEKSFESHCNLSIEAQAPVFARSSEEFVFNITENGKTIIGAGLEGFDPFNGSELTTTKTEDRYKEVIEELQKNQKFNAENLLKIFPKDANLAITPYAEKKDGNNILYSISAEWNDGNGKRWEMRIHSTDLKLDNNSSKWTFRLGHGGKYLQKNENGVFDYEGKFSGPKSVLSHIPFESPIEENNLLNNIDFQKIIRELSANLV